MTPSSGSEKTERATPKKREDARKKGQVLKSQDLSTAFTLLLMFGALSLFGGSIVDGMRNSFVRIWSMDPTEMDFSVAGVSTLLTDVILGLLGIVAPLMIVAVLAGAIINFVQVGVLFTTKTLKPKFSRINPLEGFKRIISMRTLVELVKSVLKITVVSVIAWQDFSGMMFSFGNLMNFDLVGGLELLYNVSMGMAFKCGVAFLIVAVFDYLYQWWEHEKQLKMTKQEVKDEYKQIEGDPQVKSKRKQKQREMSAMRMMHMVPEADVVITNPTHYAIALKYEEQGERAPIVIAKGKDHLALRIKEVAKEHNIEMVENKPLAQALYLGCELGDEIPPEFYQAIAEILAYIYKQKHRV